jgi:hypothetical protein
MKHPTDLDQLRITFRDAYEHYVQEGWRMRDLLMKLESCPDNERREAITSQQKVLDDALREYEEARSAYVQSVLAGFASTGGALL